MGDAVQITVVGMSFVFGAILLLWGLMVLVVRFTQAKTEAADEGDLSDTERKNAAAAAVAVMLALHDTSPKPFPAPPTALVSAWQAVRRSNQLKDRGFKR
ncbi:MAG: OadG family protein [Anaerolineae bacterium]|nr:OadG family protein [Anaerolineae bacterium]